MPATFVNILEFLLLAWLAAVAGLVAYKMLTGGIRLDGLLSADGTTPVSVERVQLLIGTISAAGGYLIVAVKAAREAAPGTLNALPDFPVSLLVLFGGSSSFYLMSKFIRMK